jgi:hypothetical protein
MGKIYRIKSEIFGALFEIKVNDIPVIRQFRENPSTTKTTINEWISNGDNEITIKLGFNERVVYTEETSLDLIIYEIDSVDIKEEFSKTILEIKMPDYDENKPPVEFFKSTFIIKELPLTPAFMEGTVIKPNVEVFKMVIKKYYLIEDYLSNKKLDDYFKFIEPKELEYAALYYENYDTRVKEDREIIESEYLDPNNKIFKLQEKYLRLKIYNYGKLICIEDVEDNPCIFFFNAKTNDATFIPTYFYYNKSKNDFIAIR